jgi:hypothetical protein
MDRLRFSIRGLVAFVIFVAVAIASLRDGSALWDCATFSATLLTLTASVLSAVHLTGRARAFWVGFALCGSVYLGASLLPEVRPRLLTTRILVYLGTLVPSVTVDLSNSRDPAERSRVLMPDGSTRPGVVLGFEGGTGKLYASRGGPSEYFYPIGHSLCAVAVGFAGGLLSRYLYAVGRRGRASPTVSEESVG